MHQSVNKTLILPPDKNEAYLVRATAETSIPGILLELTDWMTVLLSCSYPATSHPLSNDRTSPSNAIRCFCTLLHEHGNCSSFQNVTLVQNTRIWIKNKNKVTSSVNTSASEPFKTEKILFHFTVCPSTEYKTVKTEKYQLPGFTTSAVVNNMCRTWGVEPGLLPKFWWQWVKS